MRIVAEGLKAQKAILERRVTEIEGWEKSSKNEDVVRNLRQRLALVNSACISIQDAINCLEEDLYFANNMV